MVILLRSVGIYSKNVLIDYFNRYQLRINIINLLTHRGMGLEVIIFIRTFSLSVHQQQVE